MSTFRSQAMRTPQRGVVLVIALMFMMVLTMISLASMRELIADERAAGNERDQNIALSAAEAALRDAEYDLFSLCAPYVDICDSNRRYTSPKDPVWVVGATLFGSPVGTANSCSTTGETKGLCFPKVNTSQAQGGTRPNYPLLDRSVWFPARVALGTRTGAPAANNVSNQPAYVIEALSYPADATRQKTIYRITAIGYGRSAATEVVMQSYVTAPDIAR
jgi:type IV pilus assembly protein PilX